MELQIKLSSGAKIPERHSKYAAGLDLATTHPVELWRRDYVYEVHTGISVAIPEGFEGQIRLRSSIGKCGIIMPNAPGTVDSDYRGEIIVLLMSMAGYVRLQPGDRIAQLVIAPIAVPEIKIVQELPPTERGEGGFGSTGRSSKDVLKRWYRWAR